MGYRAIWRQRTGARYEVCNSTDLAATDEDGAIAELVALINQAATTWVEDGYADIEVRIVDDGGNVIHAEHIVYSGDDEVAETVCD